MPCPHPLITFLNLCFATVFSAEARGLHTGCQRVRRERGLVFPMLLRGWAGRVHTRRLIEASSRRSQDCETPLQMGSESLFEAREHTAKIQARMCLVRSALPLHHEGTFTAQGKWGIRENYLAGVTLRQTDRDLPAPSGLCSEPAGASTFKDIRIVVLALSVQGQEFSHLRLAGGPGKGTGCRHHPPPSAWAPGLCCPAAFPVLPQTVRHPVAMGMRQDLGRAEC